MSASEKDPWQHVGVQPSYGAGKALVNWQLKPRYRGGEVYVYRSLDGNEPWDLLNENTPVIFADTFEDTTFFPRENLRVAHYRLLLVFEEKTYPSPTIGLLDRIKRHEYGAVHTMMSREFLRMRAGNGVMVWLLPPLVSGEVAAGVDPLTFQKLSEDCIQKTDGCTVNTDGFGNVYAGGFGTPLLTWVEFRDAALLHKEDDAAAGNVPKDFVKNAARFLAFPRPQPGYVVASPDTDNRFVVQTSIRAYNFKGTIPVAYDAELRILDRNDPRYRVKLPPLPAEKPYPCRRL